jgi:flavodoxin
MKNTHSQPQKSHKLMGRTERQGYHLKSIVLYSSKGGNTEKIAREIASELNCRCEKISANFDSTSIDLNDFNLVFVGTGNYSARPSDAMLNYLKEMNLNDSRHFALFMTWIGRGTTDKAVYKIVKAAIEAKGQKLLENYYSCLGGTHSKMERGIARLIFPEARGHPNAEDLVNARKWAKELAKSI